MIIVKLKGALGNQMFQYAFGRKLSLQAKTELKLDIGPSPEAFQKNTSRQFSLQHFNISAEIASIEETRRLKYPWGLISKGWRAVQFWVLKQYRIGFDQAYLKIKNDVYMDGFWHSENYFKDIRDILLKDFSLRNPLSSRAADLATQIRNSPLPTVSIHVRRGDYASDPNTRKYHGLMNVEYYNTGLGILREKFGKLKVFAFSDEIEWVKANLQMEDDHLLIGQDEVADYESLHLMSLCQHNIIANSSFSWWAAWLNQSPDKVVIAPQKWLAKTGNDYYKEIPESWMKI